MDMTTSTPSIPPPRFLRHSPARRPLHEQSDSETNALVTPFIRLVDDSFIYATDPFPTQPSQILVPSGFSSSYGTAFVSSEDATVSSRHPRSKSPLSSTSNSKNSSNLTKPTRGTSDVAPLTNAPSSCVPTTSCPHSPPARFSTEPSPLSRPRFNAYASSAVIVEQDRRRPTTGATDFDLSASHGTAVKVNALSNSCTARAMTGDERHDELPRDELLHQAGPNVGQAHHPTAAAITDRIARLTASVDRSSSPSVVFARAATRSLETSSRSAIQSDTNPTSAIITCSRPSIVVDEQQDTSDAWERPSLYRARDEQFSGQQIRENSTQISRSRNLRPTSVRPAWLSLDPEPYLGIHRSQTTPSNVSVASSASSETLGGRSHKSPSRYQSGVSYSAFPRPITPTSPSTQPRRTRSTGRIKGSSTIVSASAKTSISSRSSSPRSDVLAIPAIRPGPRVQFPIVHRPPPQSDSAESSLSNTKRVRVRVEATPSSSMAPSRRALSTFTSEAGWAKKTSWATDHQRNSGLRLHPVELGSNHGLVPPTVEISAPETDEEPPAILSRSLKADKGKARATIGAVDQRGQSQDEPNDSQRRSKRASMVTTPNNSHRNSRGDMPDQPSSRTSFMAIGVPNWARNFYSRGGRDSFIMGGDSTAAREILEAHSDARRTTAPQGIMPPKRANRTRPHRIILPSRNSLEIMSAPQTGECLVREVPRKRATDVWSPRLQHDRRATMYSVWEPPAFQEKIIEGMMSLRGMQVVAFCVGFIFPLAWIGAAFLPLPYNPNDDLPFNVKDDTITRADIEKALDRDVGAIDENRYENARWWRNVNRIMSLVGLLIIAAIIAMVVVSVRTGVRIPSF